MPGQSAAGRNYWENPREQARRKARRDIRERVFRHRSLQRGEREREGGERQETKQEERAGEARPSSPRQSETREVSAAASSLLERVLRDDRSFFSLQSLRKRFDVLDADWPIELLWTRDGSVDESAATAAVLVGREQFRSWLGAEGCSDWERYLKAHLASFTLVEFAVWAGRYHVVGALLLGGVNPCKRGREKPEANGCENDDREPERSLHELERVGCRAVLPKFFDGVPLSLSSYVVKRVVEMRRHRRICPNGPPPAERRPVEAGASRTGNPPCRRSYFDCALCHQRRPRAVLLQFCSEPPDLADECEHVFCEPCFWKDLVECLDDRHGDVVVCPVCEQASGHRRGTTTEPFHPSDPTSPKLSPLERRLRSQERFWALPAAAADLKHQAARRKRKLRPPIASTWYDAVAPSLGLTQDVRRDRFWRNVEESSSGSFHYVRAALHLGVDVTEPNQYGQTPLYAAAWKGDLRLVALLLEYHDANDLQALPPANGGSTVLGVAQANRHTEIVQLLRDRGAPEATATRLPLLTDVPDGDAIPDPPTLKILIDPSADHPGAGSYVIDRCIASSAVDALCQLWAMLRTEVHVKPKAAPCASRKYYCDAERRIAVAILPALRRFFAAAPADEAEVMVLPHLRFLCYGSEGIALAPHVDLPRVDLLTNARSTHTLLLYLSDCESGGETALLECDTGPGREAVLARVRPKRGRLLLFPHECPHEGEPVVDVPKLLLRGEARLPPRLTRTK